jgi:F-type H+-transporting ATPase subunit a
MSDPLAPQHLFGHVEDSTYFHVPEALAPKGSHGHINIPQPFDTAHPVFEAKTESNLINRTILPLDLKITKFMILEVAVAMIIFVVFVVLAKGLRNRGTARGRLWNMLEVFLLFIRDEIARPCIGRHDADRFVPFLWTMFLFVLGCNLMGMIPWMGSPTGALATTGALAFITFSVVVGAGMKQLGAVGFWKAQVPHMDLPGPIAPIMNVFIFFIEVFGLCVKHAVLAVRLLANMMAGHVVLAVIIAFIGASATAGAAVWGGVAIASVLGATAISMLELFVAFLQAYIFTFLSALFIGAAVHPH